MSTYRGYVPWKSTITPGYQSTKTDTGSRYSSRDDVSNTENKVSTQPRFGSLTSPSTYRPSYSGGTYRSAKRDITPTTTTTTTKYTSNAPSKEPSKEKDETVLKKYSTLSTKLNSSKISGPEVKPSRFLSSSSTLNSDNKISKFPTNNVVGESNKVSSRYPSPATTLTTNDTKAGKYSSTSSLCAKAKLRDPSPVIERRSTLNVSSIRSRDTSPATTSATHYLRSKSRDPSPAESIRGRYTSPLKNYSNSYNILNKPRKELTQYGTTLGPALSYMTASEVTARNKTRRERVEREKKELSVESDIIIKLPKTKENDFKKVDLDEIIKISVVTRATSPTPPNVPAPATVNVNYGRARRTDLAKTIEKIIQKPIKKPPCVDKEIQSDRLDDTSKYSRFKNSRIASWTSFLDNNSSKNSATNSVSSRSSTGSSSAASSIKSEVEKKKIKEFSNGVSKNSSALLKSSSSKSISKEKLDKTEKIDKVKTETKVKNPLKSSSSKKSLDGTHQLPPLAPKADSPAKSVAALSECAKFTNKDFRKSVLNIGPSDRPRKSRTSSVDSESEGVEKVGYRLQGRTERSPSSSSTEVSSSSCSTSSVTTNSSTKNHNNLDESPKPATTSTKRLSSRASFVNKAVDQVDQAPKNQVVEQTVQNCSSSNDRSSANTSSDVKSNLKTTSLGPVSKKSDKKSSTSNSNECYYQDENNSTSISESLEQDSLSLLHAPTINSNENYYDPSGNNMPLNEFDTKATIKLRHIDSGELPWWLNNENDDNEDDDTTATDITLNQSEIIDPPTEAEGGRYKIRHIESGEKAWWMRESPNLVTDASSFVSENTRKSSNHQFSNGQLKDVSQNSSHSIRENSSSKSSSRIFRTATSDEISKSSSSSRIKKNNETTEGKKSNNEETSQPFNRPVYRIRHIESGEKAWWMTGENENENSAADLRTTSATIKLNNSSDSSANKSIKEKSSSPKVIPKYKIRHIESGEKAWWMQDDDGVTSTPSECMNTDQTSSKINPNNLQKSVDSDDLLILGDRASPEGLEDPSKRLSLCEVDVNNADTTKVSKKLFISRHRNIDDLLGGSSHPLSPLSVDSTFALDEPFEKITPDQVKIHEGFLSGQDYSRTQNRNLRNTQIPHKTMPMDDASIQVYKDGDYGAYLDLESSLAEQIEDIDGLQSSRKNSLVVRTQLSVRVHTIIEKLLTSKGRDLRRALFSLKQIFQEDKDLVHGFVALGGLNCLVRVGSDADQNYQNYILRALGQVMLYVDGMNGVMKHGPTIQWLYTLIASKYRLVVKTALKLLLVFVEYIESNSYLLVNAIHTVDSSRGMLPWSNIMKLLKDYENSDTELLIYATSLINKTLSGLSDQDSFYDESDYLEQQGMESVIQRHMSRPGTDLDLLDQLQVYEEVLKFEDGETDGICIHDNSIRKTLRYRANNFNGLDSNERRKSRRHSTGNSPIIAQPTKTYSPPNNHQHHHHNNHNQQQHHQTADEDSSSSANSGELSDVFNVAKTNRESAGVTPGLRRRRERVERQKTFMKEQQEAASAGLRPFEQKDEQNTHGQIVTAMPVRLENCQENLAPVVGKYYNNGKSFATGHKGTTNINSRTTYTNGISIGAPLVMKPTSPNIENGSNRYDYMQSNKSQTRHYDNQLHEQQCHLASRINEQSHTAYETEINRINEFYNSVNHSSSTNGDSTSKNSYVPAVPNTVDCNKLSINLNNGNDTSYTALEILEEPPNEDKKLLLQLKRDHTVKDLTQKLSNLPISPQEEKPNRIGDMTGLISKAKEGLAKSKSKGEISRSPSVDQDLKKAEPKKSENELHWEELVQNMDRPLILCDLDFTDLHLEDDKDNLAPRGLGGTVPPPPPPIGGSGFIAPPPMLMHFPPPPTNLPPPQSFNHMNGVGGISGGNSNDLNGTIKKNKKTVKLFWKEVRDDLLPAGGAKTIWDELPETTVDVKVLEHLFESRAKDLMAKKQQEINKNKEIIVLDHKRSNAINIAMTKLPPPRAIKAAILKMDATVVTREGIEKLLNMLPTDEERGKIQEAQVLNPELPLGSAEQFLLTLSSISELAARLKLWAFKLDFEISEKEIAEPLMDLKQGIETLRNNKTFKSILATLLSIGIFLNGALVKGFQIEYLAKVPEVKDTVHKHSLLHHLCHMVMDNCPQTTDLYSEIGPVTRASKADFADLAHNIAYLEKECKASWDRLKLIAKHDCPPQLKQKLIDFLADCAERIIILDIVHRRVINRYRKFLLWLGVPQHRILESRPNEVCRIVSEFALEYRTTRERVQQQIEKKANHRERNKTRGKMIIDVAKIRSQEDRADAELRQILGSPNTIAEKVDQNGTLTWRRRRNDNIKSPKLRLTDENLTDGDDELLETLVKTATKATGPRQTPRERKRTRHADRKSLRRTLKNGITEEELQHVTEVIKNF